MDTSASDVSRAFHSDIFTRAVYASERQHYNSFDDDYSPAIRMLLVKRERPFLDDGISTAYVHGKNMHRLPPMYDPAAVAPPIDVFCPGDASFSTQWSDTLFCRPLAELLFAKSAETEAQIFKATRKVPRMALLPQPSSERFGFSPIRVPPMSKFVTDSGKLVKLDSLLTELKANDHRVLIYFQMTRMMDLMEEFLSYRQYKYVRLDGSSKLSDRRDLVNDWQTKPELFVFLLSTRAGGLGINLTAADTVIFYDSDWNPTIDSQAMDRAHRLGQTKQVTVYRLLVRGTIEERMRDRAKQKMHVQQVVMEGGASAGENAAAAASLNSGGKGEKVVAKGMRQEDEEESKRIEDVSYWARE